MHALVIAQVSSFRTPRSAWAASSLSLGSAQAHIDELMSGVGCMFRTSVGNQANCHGLATDQLARNAIKLVALQAEPCAMSLLQLQTEW